MRKLLPKESEPVVADKYSTKVNEDEGFNNGEVATSIEKDESLSKKSKGTNIKKKKTT